MSEAEKRRIRDSRAGPGTLISGDCKIKGKVTGRGHFMIGGEIEGDCDIQGLVTLADSAVWRGTIKAESVIVAGKVEGDICASGRVEISDTARISGTVSGDAIAVAEGAVVEGVMQTTGRNEPVEFVEKRQGEGED